MANHPVYPSRAIAVDSLCKLSELVRAERSGFIVFLHGEPGSGRTTVLDHFARRVAGIRHPVSELDEHDGTSTTAWSRMPTAAHIAGSGSLIAAPVAALGFDPAGVLLASGGAALVASGELLLAYLARRARNSAPRETTPEGLLHWARDQTRPTALTVDDTHQLTGTHATDWYFDFLARFADARDSTPVLLVLGIDPTAVDSSIDEKIQALMDAKAAVGLSLDPITEEELTASYSVDLRTARAMVELTAGNASALDDFWTEATASGLVTRRSDHRFHIADKDHPHLGAAWGDLLHRSIASELRPAHADVIPSLAAAAVEGRTFTVAGLPQTPHTRAALNQLAQRTERRPPLLTNAPVNVGAEQIDRYTFSRIALWRYLDGADALRLDSRADIARRLLNVLPGLYRHNRTHIVDTLARLGAETGDVRLAAWAAEQHQAAVKEAIRERWKTLASRDTRSWTPLQYEFAYRDILIAHHAEVTHDWEEDLQLGHDLLRFAVGSANDRNIIYAQAEFAVSKHLHGPREQYATPSAEVLGLLSAARRRARTHGLADQEAQAIVSYQSVVGPNADDSEAQERLDELLPQLNPGVLGEVIVTAAGRLDDDRRRALLDAWIARSDDRDLSLRLLTSYVAAGVSEHWPLVAERISEAEALAKPLQDEQALARLAMARLRLHVYYAQWREMLTGLQHLWSVEYRRTRILHPEEGFAWWAMAQAGAANELPAVTAVSCACVLNLGGGPRDQVEAQMRDAAREAGGHSANELLAHTQRELARDTGTALMAQQIDVLDRRLRLRGL